MLNLPKSNFFTNLTILFPAYKTFSRNMLISPVTAPGKQFCSKFNPVPRHPWNSYYPPNGVDWFVLVLWF